MLKFPMLSFQTLVVKILKSQLCIMSVFSQTLGVYKLTVLYKQGTL